MMMMMAVWGDCGNKYWEMSRPGPGLRVWPGTRGQARTGENILKK